ncbi:hypothetical protein GF389_01195 [Candidatus Dojkabacteria bacterium]|nr:hypothetical protein [Candidatus Dojkabacteria bacterium]
MDNSDKAESILRNIADKGSEAVLDSQNRQYKMVEAGKRIPNPVMRAAVEKMRKNGMEEKQIVDKVLLFDELAEKDELLDYLNKEEK